MEDLNTKAAHIGGDHKEIIPILIFYFIKYHTPEVTVFVSLIYCPLLISLLHLLYLLWGPTYFYRDEINVDCIKTSDVCNVEGCS